MEEDQDDIYSDSENEVDTKRHDTLLENLQSLDSKQPVKKPTRTEPTIEISEYNLVKSITGNKDSVKLHELTKPLKERASHVQIGKQVKKADKKTKTLEKPLEKPQAEKIRRTVAYEKVKEEISRWEPVVTSHRASTYLSFPLNYDTKLEINSKRDIDWRVKSDLDKAIEELEKEAEKKTEVYEVEPEPEVPMTLQEMMERRKELAKLRRFQSYREIKARMQNKIKSKKYRRILRKEKAKQQMKDFETLQQTNPEEALKKLDEIEKSRAQERASLRHKSTGKWAKNQQIRAKYDKESRQVLAEQLAISKELTQKQKIESSDSEDEKVDNDDEQPSNANGDLEFNFWLNRTRPNTDKTHMQNVVDVTDKYIANSFKKNEVGDIKRNEANDLKEKEANDFKNKEANDFKKKEANYFKKKEANDFKKKKENDFKKNEDKIPSNRQRKVNDTSLGDQIKSKKCKRKNDNQNAIEEDDSKLNRDDVTKMIKNVSKEKEVDVKAKKSKKTKTKLEDKPRKKKIKLAGMSGEWAVDDSYVDDLANKLEDKLKDKLVKKSKKIKKFLETPNKNQSTKNTLEKNKQKKPVDLTLRKSIKYPIIDEPLKETDKNGEPTQAANEKLETLKSILSSNTPQENPINGSIEPNKYLKINPVDLETDTPDLFATNDNEENTNMRGIIAEAFEDEDITEDFAKDKQEEIDKDTPKDLDLFLPGWGTWGGTNIKNTKRRGRFIMKVPKDLPRKDGNKGDLIINENAEKAVKSHLVSDVPFPFKSVKDYEASIRAPIGNTFVPETAFRRFTKPAVTTKLGTVIDPVDEDVLMRKMKKIEKLIKVKKDKD